MCTVHGTPLKSIRLNKHLNAVSGKSVEETLRAVNMADVEEGGNTKSCVEGRISKINEINAVNENEITKCVTSEEEAIKETNKNFDAVRGEIDGNTRNIIEDLEQCLAIKDNFESTECTAKYDSVNSALTDNSGFAVQVLENMKSEIANTRAERRYCVDKSVRTAQKKIAEEQKGIQVCLNDKQ